MRLDLQMENQDLKLERDPHLRRARSSCALSDADDFDETPETSRIVGIALIEDQ
jgi:hypothetical protein